MKILARTYKDKNYDVAVYLKNARGSVENKMLQHWSLSSNSAENAKWFAVDILSGMSANEIFDNDLINPEIRDRNLKSFLVKYNLNEDDAVGWNVASIAFGFDIIRE